MSERNILFKVYLQNNNVVQPIGIVVNCIKIVQLKSIYIQYTINNEKITCYLLILMRGMDVLSLISL